MVDLSNIAQGSKGLDVLKIDSALHIAELGSVILTRNQFDLEKSLDDVCFFLNYAPTPKQAYPYQFYIDYTNRTVYIDNEYAKDGKCKTMFDPLGWSANAFFRAFCYSQIDWTRNDRDILHFFDSDKNDSTIPITEYIAFGGQFYVMEKRGNTMNIDKVVELFGNGIEFESYKKIAGSLL